MSKTELRIGIIGAGLWVAAKHGPAICEGERTVLTAVCRRNPKKLEMIQERLGAAEAYTDWRAMLDQAALDAVLVLTPHHLHCEQTVAALDRGLHVLVQSRWP